MCVCGGEGFGDRRVIRAENNGGNRVKIVEPRRVAPKTVVIFNFKIFYVEGDERIYGALECRII